MGDMQLQVASRLAPQLLAFVVWNAIVGISALNT